MRLFNQSATILLAMAAIILIVYTPLSLYMAPILGFVIVVSMIFIVLKKRAKRDLPTGRQDQELFVGSNKEIFIVTVALFLAVFLTGGLQSNLFFLLYFLLFGIVFIYEPETVFVLLLGIGAVFLQPILEGGELVGNLIKLGSLAFLSPISYFFGKEFKRREKLEHEIEDKTGQILEDAQVLRDKANDEETIEEIEDIEKKAEELRKDSQSD